LLLAVTAGLLVAGIPPLAALALAFVVLTPYLAVLALGDARIHLVPLPARAQRVLRDALGSGLAHPRALAPADSPWRAIWLMTLALVLIIAGSTVMVDTSVVLADEIGLSHLLVGLLILAVVTSLPNASTALRLARQGRADATVSETLNSNNINLLGGILIPAAILGLGTVSSGVPADLVWLLVLTAATLGALATRSGIGRLAGAALVGGYIAFVIAHLV
jgi:Ca2+/H+ antiporter